MEMPLGATGDGRLEPFRHSIHPYPTTGDTRRKLILQVRNLRKQLSDTNKYLKQANDAREKLHKKLSQNKYDNSRLLDSINIIMATLSAKITEFANSQDTSDQSQILLTLSYLKQDIISMGLANLADFLDMLNIQCPMAFISTRPLVPRTTVSQTHP